MKIRFALLLLSLAIIPYMASAQAVDNLMRSNGRIYVVVAVILIILVGLILYLVRIEKKVNKLANDNKD